MKLPGVKESGKKSPQRRAAVLLHTLVPQGEPVDRFDASYLDDLPDILRELHGITSGKLGQGSAGTNLAELLSLAGLAPDSPLEQLAPALRSLGLSDAEFGPKHASDKLKHKNNYDRVEGWAETKGVVVGAGDVAVDKINEVQKQYSLLSGGDKEEAFSDLARPETGDPWTPLIKKLINDGVVRKDEPALTIGPRWVGEIHYFRDVLGLSAAIGLDLFSHDPELVKVGDMHAMPFDDSTFGLVYQRNTFNKSYDIRKALSECVRVLRSGGVLISDDCLGYTDGVSELARTSIPSNRWLLAFLGDSVAEVIHDVETPSKPKWFDRAGQLAVRIVKPGV